MSNVQSVQTNNLTTVPRMTIDQHLDLQKAAAICRLINDVTVSKGSVVDAFGDSVALSALVAAELLQPVIDATHPY